MARYIDADALIAAIQQTYCADCNKRKGKKRGKECVLYEIGEAPCKSCGVMDAMDDIENAPTADVAPVVHGRWLDRAENPRLRGRIRVMCSICGAFAPYEMVNVGSFKENETPYCPNCGAKMDGGEDE